MKKNKKNKKVQTFNVYSTLPEYQYVTGVPKAKSGTEFFTYDDYLTDLVLAQSGTELDGNDFSLLPPDVQDCINSGGEWDNELETCVKKTVNVDGNKDYNEDDNTDDNTDDNQSSNFDVFKQKYLTNYNLDSSRPFNMNTGDIEYGVPKWMQDSPLMSAFGIVGDTRNFIKDIGTGNINPRTGRKYSYTDFSRNTLTNTTDENVVLNTENLLDAYTKSGKIKKKKNTADNLFMSQNEAKQKYFNILADQHSKEYVDDLGNPLLSKQVMNDDGTISYADIEVKNPDYVDEETTPGVPPTIFRQPTEDELTAGDIAQDNLKDYNVQRIKYDDYSDVSDANVTEISSFNEDGDKVVADYDPDKNYKDHEVDIEWNVQDKINEQFLEKTGGELMRATTGTELDYSPTVNQSDTFSGYGNQNINVDAYKERTHWDDISDMLSESQNVDQGQIYSQTQRNIDNLKQRNSLINLFSRIGDSADLLRRQDGGTSMSAGLCGPVWSSSGRWMGCDQRNYDPLHNFDIGVKSRIGKDEIDPWLKMALTAGYTNTQRGGTGGLSTYIGGNYGGILQGTPDFESGEQDITFTPDANLVASLGWKDEFKNKSDYTAWLRGRDKNPLQWGLGAFYNKNILGDQGDVLGGYTSLGNLNLTGGYNFGTKSPEFGVTIGLPIRQDGGPESSTFEETYTVVEDGVTRQVTKEEFDQLMSDGKAIDISNFNTTTPNQAPAPTVSSPDDLVDGTPIDVPVDNNTWNWQSSDAPTFDVNSPDPNVNPYTSVDSGPTEEEEEEEGPLKQEFGLPELTDEQMANMTDKQIRQYNRKSKATSLWNQGRAFVNTGVVGGLNKAFRDTSKWLVDAGEKVSNILAAGDRERKDREKYNLMDDYGDINPAIEASRSDKGDFDINTGDYRVNTLGYGDGPRGQIAQMGGENMNQSTPPPNYAYLREFLNQSIVGYDPEFLMMQAKHGSEVIDADMDLIKQLMAAGADFEIL